MVRDFFKELCSGLSFDRKRCRGDVKLFQKQKVGGAAIDEVPGVSAQPSDDVEWLQTKEGVARYRKRHRIRVDANEEAPSPAARLEDLEAGGNFHPRVAAALRRGGFEHLTACQQQCYPLICSDFDVLCCAPTGSGKTLAFLAPIFSSFLFRRERCQEVFTHAVVLSPTRELAAQTSRVLKGLAAGSSVRVKVDNGGLHLPEEKKDAVPDFVVCTPLTFEKRKASLKLSKIRALVLDEADRLLLDDASRASVQEIVDACTSKRRRLHFFSATIPEVVDGLAVTLMRRPARVYIGVRNTPVSHVRQQLVYCGHGGQETGKLLALKQVLSGKLNELGESFGGDGDDELDHARVRTFPCLIFCRSVERCQALFQQVRALFASLQPGAADPTQAATRVVALHGGMPAQRRRDALIRFRTGEAWVLVATDVLSRGVDFAGVRLVLNYDFPASSADYVHRVGRAGRAPSAAATADVRQPLARAVTLYTSDDAEALRPCASLIREAGGGAFLPEWIERGVAPSSEGMNKNYHKTRKRGRKGTWAVAPDPGANAITGRRSASHRTKKPS